MVLDYKDVAFSFQKRTLRRRRRRLKLALLLLLLAAIFGGYRFLQARAAVGKIQDLLLSGRSNEADKKISALSPLFMRAQFRELRALSDLFNDRLPEARARFAALRGQPASAVLRPDRFQKYFFDRGEYHKLKTYSDYLLPRGGDENLWYQALVQAAFFDGPGSEKTLAELSPAFRRSHAKALALLAVVQADLRRGRCDVVFDRKGAPLAYYDVPGRRVRSLLPGFDFAAFDRQLKNGLSCFQLTLDGGLQRKIGRLFADYSGTLLIFDLPQNAIVAAYSKSASGRGPNAVFVETFEPGAIVKVVTLLAYLRQPDQGLFPYDCPGKTTIDGTLFYDRMAHGGVTDPATALAVSCNLAFAEMGLQVGTQRLVAMLELFQFNSRPFRDWFMEFRTGRCGREGGGELALANLAVGHGDISLTTVHAAVLASVMAQNGVLAPPYLIEDAKSILNLGYYSHHAEPRQLLADDLNFRRVKIAMATVVNDGKGTGRRAGPAAGLAVKTGSSSNGRGGFDALVIGFYPVANPRFAFAFRLENAGRAELNGALFLRDLAAILAANE